LAFALLAGALLFALQLRRPQAFVARAELLLRENSLSTDRTRLSRADLRGFVENVALTSSRLMAVMDKHGLFRSQAAKGPVLALAEMRKSIDIDIVQDYFAEDRLERSPVRSARIVIAFRGDEPEQALVVVRDLGLLVTEAELGRHADKARREAGAAHAAAAEARAAATRTEAELAAMEMAAPASPTAGRQVKVAFLRAWLTKLDRQHSDLEQEHARLDLAAAAEEKQAGTRVHLASLQGDSAGPHSDARTLRRKAATAGAVGLVLALLFVGAFDPRLYDADDVRRAGGLSLGTLHRPHTRRHPTSGDRT
jgi:hypothetical protein